MPFTANYPFRRLFVDHMIDGISRVWWQLDPALAVTSPLTFQLQAGYAGLPDATDWVDVGAPVEDAWYADDDQVRLRGKTLVNHYRVKLTTPTATYMSNPVGVYGIMPEEDWLLAREIVRKEILRSKRVGREGVLLKRIRYGARCTRCRDPLTKEVTDSRCPLCRGTGFLIGYHPPARMQCWDVSPETLNEQRNGTTPVGQSRDTRVNARVLGFPDLALEDVWVDGHSDQRWYVNVIEHISLMRGVPIIMNVTMDLAPYTDAIYRVPIGQESNDDPRNGMPTAGTGEVLIDHNYLGLDSLAYQKDGDANCGIEGAYVYAFLKADYLAGLRRPQDAKAATTTSANGWWTYAMQLDPGDYILVYEKPGEYGPDIQALAVTDPSPPEPPAPAQSSSSIAIFGPV